MYTKIESCIWDDEKTAGLDDDCKLLWLFLLSTKHRNIAGLYILPLVFIAHGLRWSDKRVKKAFNKLLDLGFIKYDAKTEIVFISNFLSPKHNPLENGNQVKSAIQKIDELPLTVLFADLIKALQKYYKPFNEPLIKRLEERLQKGYGKQVTVTETVKETVTVTEEEEEAAAAIRDEQEFEQGDAATADVFKTYESEIGIISPIIRDKLIDSLNEYPPDWIKLAIATAASNGVRKFSYMDACLKRWKTEGFQTRNKGKPAGDGLEEEAAALWHTEVLSKAGGINVKWSSDAVLAGVRAAGGGRAIANTRTPEDLKKQFVAGYTDYRRREAEQVG